jgi:riboflavin biosynthesis pyrimidine reductase
MRSRGRFASVSDPAELSRILPDGRALELLFEEAMPAGPALSGVLLAAYGGGSLSVVRPRLIANFVSSVDGVVALPSGGESGKLISQNSAADRFVMGLLRTLADAVLVGASTFRRTPRHLWQAGTIYPAAAREFTEARRSLGLAEQPTFVLVTASGDVDPSQPAFEGGLIATTLAGKQKLGTRVPSSCRVEVFDGPTIRIEEVLALLRSEGKGLVLTEGGPSLFSEVVARGLCDELFLTASPTLFGRYAGDLRKALADGLDLTGTSLRLLGVRRHASHLFLRYALQK